MPSSFMFDMLSKIQSFLTVKSYSKKRISSIPKLNHYSDVFSSFRGRGKYSQLLSVDHDTQNGHDHYSLDINEYHSNRTNNSYPLSSSRSSPSSSKPSEYHLISPELLNPILAWLSMILAVVSGSSIGPVFKYMSVHGIQPMQSASWRCQCMVIWLLPFAIIEYFSTKSNQKISWFEKKPGLTFKVYVHVIIAGVAWSANLLTWIIGLKYTSTVRAAIFCNIHPLVLVIFLHSTGVKVSSLEWFGVLIAVVGVCISASDGIKEIVHGTSSSSTMSSLFGDALCVISGINEVFIILNRHRIKPYVPLMQYTCVTTAIVAFFASFLSAIFEIDYKIFCMEADCIFGWTSHHWLIPMLLFGLYIGLVCMTGFNYAMMYISPLVFSSISLIDPALTGVLSWVSGLEGIPDLATWIGGIVVIGGVGAVTFGEHLRQQQNQHQHQENDNVVVSNEESRTEDTKVNHNYDQSIEKLSYNNNIIIEHQFLHLSSYESPDPCREIDQECSNDIEDMGIKDIQQEKERCRESQSILEYVKQQQMISSLVDNIEMTSYDQ